MLGKGKGKLQRYLGYLPQNSVPSAPFLVIPGQMSHGSEVRRTDVNWSFKGRLKLPHIGE